MKRMMKSAGLILILAMVVSLPVMAADSGQFTEVEGMVTVTRTGGSAVRAVLGTVVKEGDRVTSGRNGRATLLFQDRSVLKLGPSTTMNIKKLACDEQRGVARAAYELASGTLMSIVGSLFGNDESDYQITTPTAVSGVRGTILIVKVGEHPRMGFLTTMTVSLEGNVNFTGQGGGTQTIGPYTYSITDANGNPLPPDTISEQDLLDLLNTFIIGNDGLLERTFQIRWRSNSMVPGTFIPFEIVLLPGGRGDNDPDNLFWNDNPSDLVYQEPPQTTDLEITVDIP